ncbi:MAG: tRNA lysidine(34) synthetase TilS [Calditerrivibrio sp.]|nr:tRNA lysidine(34) synthetase TilS [Calditerrivibrio sp.]
MMKNGKNLKASTEEIEILLLNECFKKIPCDCKRLLVAFSGGRDSVALLHFLNRHRDKLKIILMACHVNHGLRGELGDRDERFCEDFCSRYGIEFVSKRIDVPTFLKNNKTSVEDAARRLRYQSLCEVLEKFNMGYIATAHHLDDMLETFFVKLFTGCAIYNLKGFNDTKVIRPFLGVGRDLIEKYLKKYDLEYVDDETNFSEDYVRNWVRHRILPEIRSYNKGFLQNIFSIQEQSEDLKIFLEGYFSSIEIVWGDKLCYTSKQDLVKRTRLEKRYIIGKMMERFFRVEKQHIDNAIDLLDGQSKRINLPDRFLFEVSFEKVMVFHRELIEDYNFFKKETVDIVFLPKLCKYIKFSGDLKQSSLIVRNRRTGDRVAGKKLKDILIDKKIDLFDRDRLVVVEKEGNIIWVESVYEGNEEIKIYSMED